ncbi:MAG: tetratricopeptide repeat protein [Spirochaetaceae bacterium]|nr:tetratricopeptide repeat protein [Spirochaetaceae bacterium]
MKRVRIFISVLLVSAVSVLTVRAENDPLFAGLEAYAGSNWTEAILAFRKAVASPETASPDALYWLVMAEMSAGEYASAAASADMFLASYKNSELYSDIEYQRGRALYHTGRYDDAIRQLYAFFEENPGHELASSALFWIGECMYDLGIFDTALVMYQRVVQEYSFSPKTEAASYRIALIHQQGREEELLRLLKASHEESLRVMEEYQRRERVYEQAVTAYQKRIADLLKDSNFTELEVELNNEKMKNMALTEQLDSLQEQNARMENELISVRRHSAAGIEELKRKADILQNMLDRRSGGGGS